MTREELVSEVMRLYDRDAELRRREGRGHSSASSRRLSPLDAMFVEEGKRSVFSEITGWHFDHYGPQIFTQDEEAVPFEAWFSAITPDAFHAEEMFRLLLTDGVSFRSFMDALKPLFESYYSNRVLEHLQEGDSGETV